MRRLAGIDLIVLDGRRAHQAVVRDVVAPAEEHGHGQAQDQAVEQCRHGPVGQTGGLDDHVADLQQAPGGHQVIGCAAEHPPAAGLSNKSYDTHAVSGPDCRERGRFADRCEAVKKRSGSASPPRARLRTTAATVSAVVEAGHGFGDGHGTDQAGVEMILGHRRNRAQRHGLAPPPTRRRTALQAGFAVVCTVTCAKWRASEALDRGRRLYTQLAAAVKPRVARPGPEQCPDNSIARPGARDKTLRSSGRKQQAPRERGGLCHRDAPTTQR
jgi:hypothetical protein